jgi:hypothetical protein
MAKTKRPKKSKVISIRKQKKRVRFDDQRNRKEQALNRLGLTAEMVTGLPKIVPLIQESIGTIEKALEILRGDDSPDAIQFLAKYDAIPESDRKHLTFEERVVGAGLSPRRFMEILTGASLQRSSVATRLIVAISQPEVIRATVKSATEGRPILDENDEIIGYGPGDVKAQEMFHKITTLMPTPKGNVQNFNFAQPRDQDALPAPREGDKPQPLQSMDDFLLSLHDVVRPKSLPEPEIAVEHPVNAPDLEYLDVEV